MKNIRNIIKEVVAKHTSSTNEIIPNSTNIMENDKPKVKPTATKKGKVYDDKKNPDFATGRQDDPADYDTDLKAGQEKDLDGGFFEQFNPNQLNALLETLVRDKKQFNRLYEILSREGFVPVNASDSYFSKRGALNEVIKTGRLTKHMLQSLAESKHIVIEGMMFPGNAIDRLNKINADADKYGTGSAKGGMGMSVNPEDNDDYDAVNPEDENPEAADTPDDEILAQVSGDVGDEMGGMGISNEKAELASVTNQMKNNAREFKDLAAMAGYNKPDGTGDSQAYGIFISNPDNYGRLTPEERETADWYKELLQTQKALMQQKKALEAKVMPQVSMPEPDYTMESKDMQFMRTRAGSKGKVFESRIRRMDKYKKVALLEFLDTDPRMLDEKDHVQMSILTGINENDLLAMRIEYDESLNEMTYPVFGGQDVMKQNQQNSDKENQRLLKNADASQETVETKVRDMKSKKMDAAAQQEANPNRGMEGTIGKMLADNPDNTDLKDRLTAQANGETSAAAADARKDNPDANVAHDGGMASERNDMNTGDDMMARGKIQNDEHEEEPLYNRERVPVNHNKEAVNEDLDRMKNLFGYNANKYANPKSRVNHNTVFEQQLNSFRVLSESVDMSGRPSQEQIATMKPVMFEGKKAVTDGEDCFDPKDGKKLGNFGEVEEAKNLQLRKGTKGLQFKTGTKGFDPNVIDEGEETGKKCIECGHPIVTKNGEEKCMCNDAPLAESDDPLIREMDRQMKLAGVKVVREAKHRQLRKGTKGHQLETGSEEEEDSKKAKY